MDKSLGILLNFWGVFQFTHTLPLPSPHKQRWTHVAEFFPQFQLCIEWGRENCKKISKRMHCFMIACVQTTSSPLRFLLRGGGGESQYRLFYEGAQKLEEVMNTIMNTEIMNTFPKTFVQDCSYFYHHYFPSFHVCFFIFL